MTWNDFFSSLGGLFGLCLGFSIISFIEVIVKSFGYFVLASKASLRPFFSSQRNNCSHQWNSVFDYEYIYSPPIVFHIPTGDVLDSCQDHQESHLNRKHVILFCKKKNWKNSKVKFVSFFIESVNSITILVIIPRWDAPRTWLTLSQLFFDNVTLIMQMQIVASVLLCK